MKEKLSVKLAGMTFKEKIDFIWTYYNIPIVGVIICLLFIGSIINSVFINPPKKQHVQLTVYGPFVDTSVINNLEDKLTELLVEEKETHAVFVSNFYDNPNDIEANMAIIQKFYAMIAARELDVIIGYYDNLQMLASDGTLLDLTDIISELGIDVPEDDLLITSVDVIEDSEELPYAIKLYNSEILNEHYLRYDDCYIAILVNSSRVAESVELIKCLLDLL